MIRSLTLALLLLAETAGAQSSPTPPSAPPAVEARPAPPAAPAAPPAPPGQPRRANGESMELTWLGAGAMFTSGHTEFASIIGGALRLRPDSGLAVMLDWTSEWYGEPVVDVFHGGLMWFGSKVPLAPFADVHYALFWVQPAHDSDAWRSGIGGRLGFFPWRQRKEEGHRFGLSVFMTYDHAFSCSQSCDFWVPQAALTWEPYL
jgi:hypothetical protein